MLDMRRSWVSKKSSAPKETDMALEHPGERHKEYRVENWQIPVPIGDASAHFLLDITDVGLSKGRLPLVVSAFFMDGGDDAITTSGRVTAVSLIERALLAFDRRYGTKWKFNAIVVTHHDKDHFKGLKDFLDRKESKLRGTDFGLWRDLYFKDNVTIYSGGNQMVFNPKDRLTGAYEPIKGEHCIGIDIFSKTRMFHRHNLTHFDDIDKKRDVLLAESIPESEKHQPRFAIVGAGGYGVSTESEKQIKDPDGSKNETSILAVLYWPAEKGRTSYFTGGDGNPTVELQGVIPWMTAAREDETLPRLPIEMIKLDHHGSLYEILGNDVIKDFSGTILHKMKPSKILVTPGTRHGHPNWIVLYLVRAYFALLRSKNVLGRLYTTRSPYWMSKEFLNGKDVNPNHADREKIKSLLAHVTEKEQKELCVLLSDEDDEPVGLEYLMNEERAHYPEDDLRKKEEEREYRREHGWTTGKDGKPKKVSYSKLATMKKKDFKNLLNETRKALKDLSEMLEEPEFADLQDEAMVLAENQRNIVYQANTVWDTICKQKVCGDDPYWLVRFSFGAGKAQTTVAANLDADGKPLRGGAMEVEESATDMTTADRDETMVPFIDPNLLGHLTLYNVSSGINNMTRTGMEISTLLSKHMAYLRTADTDAIAEEPGELMIPAPKPQQHDTSSFEKYLLDQGIDPKRRTQRQLVHDQARWTKLAQKNPQLTAKKKKRTGRGDGKAAADPVEEFSDEILTKKHQREKRQQAGNKYDR
ncbi:hypothetical protein HD806DRAFT_416527 [Xylariaceae sp. AK1471]|nr:hypothetical protein HD806DRAFT_416527 [Xylariaceae sp. AK1471]